MTDATLPICPPGSGDADAFSRAHAGCFTAWCAYAGAVLKAAGTEDGAAFLAQSAADARETARALFDKFAPLVDALFMPSTDLADLRAALVPLRWLVEDGEPTEIRVLDAAAAFARERRAELLLVTDAPIVA